MRFFSGLLAASFLLACGAAGGFVVADGNPDKLKALVFGAVTAVSDSEAKSKPPVFYRDPMGLPEISTMPRKDSMNMDYLPVYDEGQTPDAAGRKLLFYRDPMGQAVISPDPRKDSMGMDYLPVYEGEPVTTPPASTEKKILYYRNPMGLPDTSPVPKKDSMGMDYIAVYDDEGAADPLTVKVPVEKAQRAGLRSEPIEARNLYVPLVAPGVIELDERKEVSVTLRAEAYIEKVYAGATGEHVTKGQPLFRVYSPQITQAIVDSRLATAGGDKDVGLRKLRNMGLPESLIAQIPRKGDVPLSIDWPSPVDGVIMRKLAVTGGRAMPGDELYRLSDVTSVWVIADVAESDIGRIHVGDSAEVTLRAFPGEEFHGKVAFILPELKAETRTARVRIELPNENHRLLHQMFAEVTIQTGGEQMVLAAPTSAIMDSGERKVALLDLGEGRFKPVAVSLGQRGNGFVEIKDGLKVGDKIVTRANFLIDAESNLQSALTALTAEGTEQ